MSNQQSVWKLSQSFGKAGSIESLFVAKNSYIQYLQTHSIQIYYGDVLGKDSRVSLSLNENNLEKISDDLTIVENISKINCQFNPMHQITLRLVYEDLRPNATEDQKLFCVDWSILEWMEYLVDGIEI